MGGCVKKWMLGALGILSAGAALAGCSREVVQTNDSLIVYAGGDDVIMDYAVREFERRYPDIPVEYKGRKVIEDAEEFYGYNQQLSAQLMSGAGADVFFIQDYWDIDKLVQAGAFADLSGIYDSCELFRDADFNGGIMDAGVFDGKRYFLPMEYRIPMMISTRETLDEVGFDIEKCTDFDSFMAESGRYMNSADYDRRLFRMDVSAMNCIFYTENGQQEIREDGHIRVIAPDLEAWDNLVYRSSRFFAEGDAVVWVNPESDKSGIVEK